MPPRMTTRSTASLLLLTSPPSFFGQVDLMPRMDALDLLYLRHRASLDGLRCFEAHGVGRAFVVRSSVFHRLSSHASAAASVDE